MYHIEPTVAWTLCNASIMFLCNSELKNFNYCPKLIIQQYYKRIKRNHRRKESIKKTFSICVFGSMIFGCCCISRIVKAVVNGCQNSFSVDIFSCRVAFIHMTYTLYLQRLNLFHLWNALHFMREKTNNSHWNEFAFRKFSFIQKCKTRSPVIKSVKYSSEVSISNHPKCILQNL